MLKIRTVISISQVRRNEQNRQLQNNSCLDAGDAELLIGTKSPHRRRFN